MSVFSSSDESDTNFSDSPASPWIYFVMDEFRKDPKPSFLEGVGMMVALIAWIFVEVVVLFFLVPVALIFWIVSEIYIVGKFLLGKSY